MLYYNSFSVSTYKGIVPNRCESLGEKVHNDFVEGRVKLCTVGMRNAILGMTLKFDGSVLPLFIKS